MKDSPPGKYSVPDQEEFFNSTQAHILFLARWYPNRYDPMLGLFVRNHALMVATFARVSLVYVQGVPGGMKKTVFDHSDDQGIQTWCVYYPVSSIRIPLFGQLWKGLLYFRANYRGIQRVIHQSGKPSLIHVHILTRLGIIALFLHWRYRIPIVITEHWSRYLPSVNTFKGILRKLATRQVVRRAAAVTTPTLNLQKAMKDFRLMNSHYFLLPNLVETDRFIPGVNKKTSDHQVVQFVHVSCFEDRSKNISGLLRAVSLLANKRKDFQCRLVGVGEDFNALSRQAEEMEIKNRFVFFAGLLEGDSLVQALNSADFMVISSHYENLPVVIGEAFSCGIPVVSTDVGGISEIISDNNGLLVKARDDQSLLAGIEYMLDHCQEYDKDIIREFAIQRFSRQTVTETLKSIYMHALNNPHRKDGC